MDCDTQGSSAHAGFSHSKSTGWAAITSPAHSMNVVFAEVSVWCHVEVSLEMFLAYIMYMRLARGYLPQHDKTYVHHLEINLSIRWEDV